MNLQCIKKIVKRIFFLSPIATILISIPSYGLVIYALSEKSVEPIIAYTSYLLSAYALVITITGVVRFLRYDIREHSFVKKMLGIPVVARYLEEDIFRAEAALHMGFLINLFYAGVKFFSGIRYRSVWFVTLAVYYILLAIMRFSLLGHVKKEGDANKNMVTEWRRYRLCGVILMLMNFALSGIVILSVTQNSGFEYPGMLIYIMAMYAFYATITAVWKVIKYRKYGSPVLSAAKVISLTAAMVSMLSLETAMLTQFGAAEDAEYRQIMTATTGTGVCVIVLGMAIYMAVYATKRLKSERSGGL